MALTFTPDTDPVIASAVNVVGDLKKVSGLITFDNSYPTGGESYNLSLFGFDQVLHHLETDGVNVAGNRLVVNDHGNKKLLLFTALGTQASNGTDQSTITVRVSAYGK